MKSTLLFLGFADVNVDLAKYADRQIWTLNDWYKYFPHLQNPDRVFDIHEKLVSEYTDEEIRSIPLFNTRYPSVPGLGTWREVYESSGAQIVVRKPSGFTREYVFPVDLAVALYGEKFFASTVSYMFALAIIEGYRDIVLEGVHLTSINGHDIHIPGTLRNIDLARSLGVKVEIPGNHENIWREKAATMIEEWKGVYK